jgi:outer membrane cobalamin receptor
MRFLRLRRPAAACRLIALVIPSVFLFHAPALLAAELTGVVVDSTGRAVPRAFVHAVDASGREESRAFTDEAGAFRLNGSGGCRVEATLAGFRAASVPCSGAQPLRIVLAVAPVEEHVIVSATRTEAPSSQAGASATVFTAADLERRQSPLVADLLEGTPGAMVVRNGAPGAVTSLFVRGGESDYNKVLLDGVPLNEPGGSYYLSNLTTENLERIEVIRGAYSSLFGTDAMSSVIQLFTRQGERSNARPRVEAQVDGGTYGTLHTTASVVGGARRVDYSFGAARLNTDNRAPNSRLENTTLSVNTGLALTGGATLRFIGRAELEHAGTPGPTAFGRPDLDAFFERHDTIGSVSFDQRVGRAFHHRASYSLAASNQQSTDLVEDAPYRATYRGQVADWLTTDYLSDSTNHLRRHHADYQADLRLPSGSSTGDQLLTLVADWDGERATAENRTLTSRSENARDNFGIAAEQQMLWRRVSATAGLRVEHNGSFGTAAVPRGTLVFVARESGGAVGDTRLRASAGTGIKEPTMLESFSLSPFFRGNPNLEPERSRSAEIGLEQRFAADRGRIDVAFFDSRYRNIISLITTDPSTFEAQYANVGLTRARGVEVGFKGALLAARRAGSAAAQTTPGVQVRAGYTLVDSKILASATPTDPIFGIGQPAFWRPRHSGYAGLTIDWRRIAADLNGVFVGRFVDSDFGLFSPPIVLNEGHQTWDARISMQLTRQLSAMLSIDNLMNRDYSEPIGYQPLLRAVRAGIRVRY